MTPDQAFAELRTWLAFFVALALFVLWFTRRRHRLQRKAWAPLTAVVNGQSKGDTLKGTHEGRRVSASVQGSPDGPPVSPNNPQRVFCISMETVPGRDRRQRMLDRYSPQGADWKAAYGYERTSDIFRGGESWHIKTNREALKQELLRVDLLDEMARSGTYPRISYSARRRRLSLEEDLLGSGMPTPEHFRSRLALLARLAQLTEEVNSSTR
jgi:hypothetical protein